GWASTPPCPRAWRSTSRSPASCRRTRGARRAAPPPRPGSRGRPARVLLARGPELLDAVLHRVSEVHEPGALDLRDTARGGERGRVFPKVLDPLCGPGEVLRTPVLACLVEALEERPTVVRGVVPGYGDRRGLALDRAQPELAVVDRERARSGAREERRGG